MDLAEEVAERFLKSLRHGEVVYEPDGNIPPDFVIANKIAVEVRRLNQNYHNDGDTQGLEHLSVRLYKFFCRLCADSGSAHNRSYFVNWSFRRPFDLDRNLKSKIHTALNNLDENDVLNGRMVILKERKLQIDIHPSMRRLPTKFRIGGYCDLNAGGWIAAEYQKNVTLICEEKFAKLAPHRHRYAEWWLVLPDFFGQEINPEDYAGIPTELGHRFGFKRIIIVSLKDPSQFCDVGRQPYPSSMRRFAPS